MWTSIKLTYNFFKTIRTDKYIILLLIHRSVNFKYENIYINCANLIIDIIIKHLPTECTLYN